MHFGIFDGVYFVEGSSKTIQSHGRVIVQLGGVFTSGQLKSLDDVKRIMVEEVRAKGGNAVVDFQYGQRSVGFFASLFNRDDVVWYGMGVVATIDRSSLAH